MKHLLELLERTAARWPDRLSYCDEHRVHTWAQTAAITAAIGSGLCHVGVQGRPVALYLDHETPCIHAMLGVMAAGGFYAVLDTAQPAARVRAITDQLRPAVLLTDEAHRQAAQDLNTGAELLLYEELAAAPVDAAALDLIDSAAQIGFDLSGYTATEPNIQQMGGLMEQDQQAQQNENLDGSHAVEYDVTTEQQDAESQPAA